MVTVPGRRVAHHDELDRTIGDPRERRGPAISATRRPKYEQVADDLRANITNGTYPVGVALPSAAALMASYQVSVTVARAAIKQLQTEGLAEGQPGKGVYVIREPTPSEPSAEFIEITRQIQDLRDTLGAAMTQLDARLTALERSLRR